MPLFTRGISRYRQSKWSAPAARAIPKYFLTLYMAYAPGRASNVVKMAKNTVGRWRLPRSIHANISREMKRPEKAQRRIRGICWSQWICLSLRNGVQVAMLTTQKFDAEREMLRHSRKRLETVHLYISMPCKLWRARVPCSRNVKVDLPRVWKPYYSLSYRARWFGMRHFVNKLLLDSTPPYRPHEKHCLHI